MRAASHVSYGPDYATGQFLQLSEIGCPPRPWNGSQIAARGGHVVIVYGEHEAPSEFRLWLQHRRPDGVWDSPSEIAAGWPGRQDHAAVFFENDLRRNLTGNVWAAEADSLVLRDPAAPGGEGRNRFFKDPAPDAKNILMYDVSGDSLDARKNYWFKADSTITTNLAWIGSTIGGPAASRVNYSSPLREPFGQANRGPGEDEAPDAGDIVAAAPAEDLPAELALRIPPGGPFRRSLDLAYDVPAGSERPVRIEVFDVSGRRVGTALDAVVGPGRYRVSWSGPSGGGLASGVYFVRMTSAEWRQTRKAVIVR